MEIHFTTKYKKLLADILTPVSIYLKVRDRFPKSILLESSDYHGTENSFSFICMEPLASIKIENNRLIQCYPGQKEYITEITDRKEVVNQISSFISSFQTHHTNEFTNGFFGYTTYNAVQYFDKISLKSISTDSVQIPDLYYSFYKYVIRVNHSKNELIVIENEIDNTSSRFQEIIQLIQNGKIAVYPFYPQDNEKTNVLPDKFIEMVKKGKEHCRRGDVFQIVLSRSFSRKFKGDEFNVYRALRNINPSPYLFFFDFGSFKLFGSSPEAQITIKSGKASINPIAGTFKRTGNDLMDKELAEKLINDPKENAEHVMLVDLARNDLSRNSKDVKLEIFREVQFYSHVIHLVSKVSGKLDEKANSIRILADTFPAGTLSGAPKIKAMELIDEIERENRGFYGGSIGYIGLNGEVNQAILIRSFLSRNNTLTYRAGAGIVEKSNEKSELAEIDNKIEALRKAIEMAKDI